MELEKVKVDEVNWNKLLSTTNSLTMWYKSSGTFLRKYEKDLKEIKSRGNLIAIVPNNTNKTLMEDYVKYYPTQYSNIEDVTTSIQKTIDILKSYKANIFLHDGIVHYPCYVTDDSYIVGLHEFGKIDDITSPCFISKNDDFIKSQIEYLVTKSIELKY